MSWGQYFDQTGDYVDNSERFSATGNEYFEAGQDNTASYENSEFTDFGQQKRSFEGEGLGSKKMKTEFGAYSEANVQKQSEELDWSSLSQITSWDQLSAPVTKQKPRGGMGGRGGRGRGGGHVGRGGSYVGNKWGESSGAEQDGGGQFIEGSSSNSSGGFGGFVGGGNSWDNKRGGGLRGQNSGGFGKRGGGNRGFSGGQGHRGFSRGNNMDRGRGGTGRGAGQKYGVLRPESATMSLVQKFEKLGQFLRGDVLRVNAIQSLENACTSLGLGLKCQYTNDEFPRVHNRLVFSGCLCINGIFLSRAVGVNKKDLKHEVYNKSLEILKTKTVKDINELKDPGVETVKMCIERILKQSQPRYQEGIGVPTNQTITDIITKIQESLDSVRQLQIGLGKLLGYLKGPQKMPDSPISRLEQSMMASKCGLRHMFQLNTIPGSEVPMYEGEFILEDTCIARATDANKKTCKQETYIAALEALTTKPVTELVIPVTQGEEISAEEEHEQNEAIVAGVEQTDGECPPAVVKPSLRDASLADRLKNLTSVLSCCAFTDQVVFYLDNCVHNSGVTSMCIYKKAAVDSKKCVACEYYLENYLIAVGIGNNKSECTDDAYHTAYDILTTSTPEELMLNFRKLKPDETRGPLVLDIVVRGEKGTIKESNMPLLHRHGFQSVDITKNISDMVIVETSLWQQDRKSYAFAILQKSASMNGMLLQWSFSSIKPPKANYKYENQPVSKHRCEIFLKGKKVSEHNGYGKNKTRNFASSDILFHLYDGNDVVKIVQLPDEERWIPYKDIELDAIKLRQVANKAAPPMFDGNGTFDKYIVDAVCERIKRFFPRNDCEELLIGPGLRDLERVEILTYAQTNNVMMEQRQKAGKTYCAMYCQPDLRHVVAALKSMSPNAKYGKFQLVPKMELPKHSDILKSTTKPQNILI